MKRKSTSSSKRAFKKPRTGAKMRTSFPPRSRAGEMKGLDTVLALTPVINTTSTNGSSFVLNLIPPGTGSWNRVGRRVQLKSLRMKLQVTYSYAPVATTFNQTPAFFRYAVVWDKQPSGGAIPSFDTIFGLTPQDGNEASTLLAPIRYDNMDRFRVLLDKCVDFDVQAGGSGGTVNASGNIKTIDEYLKLALESVYSGQTATQTIADISSGALYVYFRSSQDTAVTNVMTVSGNSFSRLRYMD